MWDVQLIGGVSTNLVAATHKLLDWHSELLIRALLAACSIHRRFTRWLQSFVIFWHTWLRSSNGTRETQPQ